MSNQFWQDGRPQNGLTWEEFQEHFEIEAHTPPDESPNPGQTRYSPLNWKRSERVEKTYKMSDEARSAMLAITTPQLWMVITEGWCGDSAQSFPIIHRLANVNPLVEIRVILRDENLDILDAYLTDGKRGIPKLVAFNRDGEELFTWGPRPREAAELFRDGLAEGTPKSQVYEKLHLWYARDRGKAIEREFTELVRSSA